MSKRIKESWKRGGESVRMNMAVGRGQPREAHCLRIEPIVTQLAEHSKSDISPLRFQIKICPLCEKHEQSKRWAPHFSHYQTRATHISALNNCTHTCHILYCGSLLAYLIHWTRNHICSFLKLWSVKYFVFVLFHFENKNHFTLQQLQRKHQTSLICF